MHRHDRMHYMHQIAGCIRLELTPQMADRFDDASEMVFGTGTGTGTERKTRFGEGWLERWREANIKMKTY